jgi:hypothetical protein
MTWKLKPHNMRISDIFSVSDEALTLVILENSALIWRNKAYGMSATDTTAHYMKQAKDGNVRKDWSDEGNRCFNDIFLQAQELQSFSLSEKTNEKELMLNEAGEMRKISSEQDINSCTDNNHLPPLFMPTGSGPPVEEIVLDQNEYNVESQITHKY